MRGHLPRNDVVIGRSHPEVEALPFKGKTSTSSNKYVNCEANDLLFCMNNDK
jgi:hypothetical protein